MFKNDKLALYFIIAIASFQSWYASVLPAGAEEAYTFFKAAGKGWFSAGHPGIGALGVYFASSFSDDIFILRLSSIIIMSIAAGFVFKSAYLLSGRISGWAALLIFIFTPTVNLAYVSATPAPVFILFSAIGFFFWIKAFESGKINYYIGAGATSGFLVMCHSAGYFLFAFALLYIILFDRKKLLSVNFIFACGFFIICPIALFIARLAGIFIEPGNLPFVFTESKSALLLITLAGTPAILYCLVRLAGDRFRTDELNFIQVSFAGVIIFFIILVFISDVDPRYAPAFLIPVFILSGSYFARKGDKVFIGIIMALSVLISAYVKVASQKGFYLPSGLKTTAIYEAISYPVAKILGNSGAVFASDVADASLYSYYTKLAEDGLSGDDIMLNMMKPDNNNMKPSKHPEPCLPGICSQKSGVFISENKEINPKTLFPSAEYYGIFRLTTPKDGTRAFYVYTVKE